MQLALHATGQRALDAAQAYYDRVDHDAEISDRRELSLRANEVAAALRQHFPAWLLAGLDLPTSFELNVGNSVDRFEKRVTHKSIDYLLEELSGRASIEPMAMILTVPSANVVEVRNAYLKTLAGEYADREAMGLAEAGWTAEDVAAWTGKVGA